MKNIAIILWVLVITVALPMMAASTAFSTTVSIIGSGTHPAIIQSAWEQGLTANLEDGDPTYITPGSQFSAATDITGKEDGTLKCRTPMLVL